MPTMPAPTIATESGPAQRTPEQPVGHRPDTAFVRASRYPQNRLCRRVGATRQVIDTPPRSSFPHVDDPSEVRAARRLPAKSRGARLLRASLLCGWMSARARQIVVGRQNMTFDDVEEFLDRHMLVEAAHAGRRRAVDDGRQLLIAPQPRIGAAEADDRG